MIEKPQDCFACFYMLFIRPTKRGDLDVSTCCTHIDKNANHCVVSSEVNQMWNASAFQYQRTLALRNDWSYCYGNKCMPYRLYPDFNRHGQVDDVQKAITERNTVLSYKPKIVWLTTSYACNNACRFCYQKQCGQRRNEYTIRQELIDEIKQEFIPYATEIILTGGEPLMNDIEMIDYIISKYPNIMLNIGTNGVLLDEFGIEKIMSHQIHLTISVYGFEESTYNKLTQSNHYVRFRSNIDQLLNSHYEDQIILDYIVLNEETWENLSDFFLFLRKYPLLNAIVRDDHWQGVGYQEKIVRLLEGEFQDVRQRVKLYFRGEKRMVRFFSKCYNKFYDMKVKCSSRL